jgi:hypothetical protein
MNELSFEEIEIVAGGFNRYYFNKCSWSNDPFIALDLANQGGCDGWSLPNGESLPT